MAVDGGCVNKWKGKQLKDISLEGNTWALLDY
jgi:hypothetical protein